MLKKVIITIISCLSFSLLYAGEPADLNRLTRECINAAQTHQAIHDNFPYKVLHTVHYEGWSGDPGHIELTNPVKMTLRFAGSSITGSYWFADNPEKTYGIRATSDMQGNIELVQINENRFAGYTFHGMMKDGVIKGLWEKGDGKKVFAFYVKAI